MKKFTAVFYALALSTGLSAAFAQQAPMPPLIRLVVPFPAGASTDVMARAVAMQLGPRLGTNVVVENRAGGGGMIGAAAVAKAPKDGSMLLLTSVSMMSNAATARTPLFDATTELVPVSMLADGPLVVAVSAKTDIRTPADLIAAARAKPDQVTQGTGGAGTIQHLAAEMLNDAAKIQLKHIPYRGSAPAVVDLSSGIVDAMFAANSTFAAQIQAGRIRPIAVTSAEPSPAFPGLPTMASVVPGFTIGLWTAVFAPAGTPPALMERLNREINDIARSPKVVELMQADGAVPLTVSTQVAAQRVRDSYLTWQRVATARNIWAE